MEALSHIIFYSFLCRIHISRCDLLCASKSSPFRLTALPEHRRAIFIFPLCLPALVPPLYSDIYTTYTFFLPAATLVSFRKSPPSPPKNEPSSLLQYPLTTPPPNPHPGQNESACEKPSSAGELKLKRVLDSEPSPPPSSRRQQADSSGRLFIAGRSSRGLWVWQKRRGRR